MIKTNLKYALQRMLQFLAVIVASTFLISLLLKFMPFDLADVVSPYGSVEEKAAISKQLGLDRNAFVTFWKWLQRFIQGDLGLIYATGQTESVSSRLLRALPKSLFLMLYTQIFALVCSIPLAVACAYKEGSKFDKFFNNSLFTLSAIPGFSIGLILSYFLGLKFPILPPLGYVSPTEDLIEHFKLMVMPVLSLSIGLITAYTRLLRNDLIASLKDDYVLMAISKGLNPRTIMWRHVFRPSSMTLITSAALNMGGLIGGTVVIENIFAIPGIGSEIVYAIYSSQIFMLQSTVAAISVFYVAINFGADLLGTKIDPRTRERRA